MFIFKDALSDHLRNLCSRWEEVKYSSLLLKRPIISRLKMRSTYISGLIHSNLSLINQLISCSLELNKIFKSYISKKPPIKNQLYKIQAIKILKLRIVSLPTNYCSFISFSVVHLRIMSIPLGKSFSLQFRNH